MAGDEFFISEGCYITELYGRADDAAVSVAQARVSPGVQTALHRLDVEERYVIQRGRGLMTVGSVKPFPVGPGDVVRIPAGTPQRIRNLLPEDLVFLCICTPRFTPEGYVELEPYVQSATAHH